MGDDLDELYRLIRCGNNQSINQSIHFDCYLDFLTPHYGNVSTRASAVDTKTVTQFLIFKNFFKFNLQKNRKCENWVWIVEVGLMLRCVYTMRQNWCDMRVNGLICATCRNKPVIIVRFWRMSHGHMFLSHRVNAPLCYWDFLSNRIEHLIMIKVNTYTCLYIYFFCR